MESRFHRANASVGRCRQGERVSEGNVPFQIILDVLLLMECSNCLLVDSWVKGKKASFAIGVDTLNTLF